MTIEQRGPRGGQNKEPDEKPREREGVKDRRVDADEAEPEISESFKDR